MARLGSHHFRRFKFKNIRNYHLQTGSAAEGVALIRGIPSLLGFRVVACSVGKEAGASMKTIQGQKRGQNI